MSKEETTDNDSSFACGLCGWGQTDKICTSCAQKMEVANILVRGPSIDDTLSNGIDKMDISDNNDTAKATTGTGMLKCANCGKEGSDTDMNTCNKCKMAKYCNATCKKKHRSKHKKQCERRLAELHEEALFKQPSREDCPICFLLMPSSMTGSKYYSCCGKVICNGCSYAPVYDGQGNKVDEKCPFCRTPMAASEEEANEREKKRFEAGDAEAIYNIGCYHHKGTDGYQQDYKKAFQLWHRSGELGHAAAYCKIGFAYNHGEGVEVDKEKTQHYYELAAMKGDVCARDNLGIIETRAGNFDRAIKHFKIAIRGGNADSSNKFRELYSFGIATKFDYMEALQSYQTYLAEIKSPQRDKAAAIHTDFKYY